MSELFLLPCSQSSYAASGGIGRAEEEASLRAAEKRRRAADAAGRRSGPRLRVAPTTIATITTETMETPRQASGDAATLTEQQQQLVARVKRRTLSDSSETYCC